MLILRFTHIHIYEIVTEKTKSIKCFVFKTMKGEMRMATIMHLDRITIHAFLMRQELSAFRSFYAESLFLRFANR